MPVYFIQAENGLIKIGEAFTVLAMEKRFRSHIANSPVPLTFLGAILEDNHDRPYHKQFAHLRHHSEWFNPAPDLLSFIEKNVTPITTEHRICKEFSESAGKPCTNRATFGDYCGKHRKDGARYANRKIDHYSTTILL